MLINATADVNATGGRGESTKAERKPRQKQPRKKEEAEKTIMVGVSKLTDIVCVCARC
jgi:hypothetical protein